MKKMNSLPGSLSIENDPSDREIWNLVNLNVMNSRGECGYKLPMLGMVDHTCIPTIVLVSADHGIILIEVVKPKIRKIIEDEYWATESGDEIFSRDLVVEFYQDEVSKRIKRSSLLFDRKLNSSLVPIRKLLIFKQNTRAELESIELSESLLCESLSSDEYLTRLSVYFQENLMVNALDDSQLDKCVSALDGTSSFERGTVNKKIKKLETVNDFIQKSLDVTFRQDDTQRQVSLQLPNGPQRIRGLAGTGKTIVLSLKAAISHLTFSEYKILFLFNTQSLYNQINELIEKYYIPEAKKPIDKSKLLIRHGWGGKDQPGLYSDLCDKYGVRRLTFNDVRGWRDGLATVYEDFLKNAGDRLEPEFDIVLIDEAQDFPPEVFEVVYKITKEPKRIVWAYDDFQTLKDVHIRPPEELFGKDKKGNPNMSSDLLRGTYEGIQKDFILANCYRNPRRVLTIAHAIALGVYSKSGLVDSIDSKQDWNALGYDLLQPDSAVIKAGDIVEVSRDKKFSRNRLEQFLEDEGKGSSKLIQYQSFPDMNSQLAKVADEIERLITKQEVDPREIIVITLDTSSAETYLKNLRILLNQKNINSIIPGYVEKSSAFKQEGCVTLTTPFRAKGNEGNVVFVINAQQTITQPGFRGRNSFFVAVTRSRGWCHIYGQGEAMNELINEIRKIEDVYPNFSYVRPQDEFIQRRRVVLSKTDKEIYETQQTLEKLLDENPELLIEALRGRGIKLPE